MDGKYYTHVLPRLQEIAEMVRTGKTDVEIAAELGVGKTTLRDHRAKHPELAAVFSPAGASQVDARRERNAAVEDALYKRATGYTVNLTKPVKIKKTRTTTDKDGNKIYESWEEVVQVPTDEHIPADTKAIEFYSVNKMGKRYKANPHQVDINRKKLKLAEDKAKKDDW